MPSVGADSVSVLSGDTAVVPYGGGIWASRGMPIGSSATLLAARAIRDNVRCLAASMLEAHEEDIMVDGECVRRARRASRDRQTGEPA